MRVWTYLRPFEYRGLDCVVEVTLTLKETISRLFIDNELVDEQSLAYSAGAPRSCILCPAHRTKRRR